MVVIREVDRLAFSRGAGTNILNSNLVGDGCSIEELEEDNKSSGFEGFHISGSTRSWDFLNILIFTKIVYLSQIIFIHDVQNDFKLLKN